MTETTTNKSMDTKRPAKSAAPIKDIDPADAATQKAAEKVMADAKGEAKDTATMTVTIRLPRHVVERLKDLANLDGTPVRVMVADVCEAKLAANKDRLDAYQQLKGARK